VLLFHRPRALRRLLSLFLAAMAWVSQAPAADRVGGAGWTMNVPEGYRHTYEDDGQTLVLTPADPDAYLLRFTYHSLKAYVKERPKVGREFITHLAAKKGLPTFAVAGNDGVAYLEPPVVTEQDGGHVQERAGGDLHRGGRRGGDVRTGGAGTAARGPAGAARTHPEHGDLNRCGGLPPECPVVWHGADKPLHAAPGLPMTMDEVSVSRCAACPRPSP
jgi:hypothetical protein